jgi:hypothetical protein
MRTAHASVAQVYTILHANNVCSDFGMICACLQDMTPWLELCSKRQVREDKTSHGLDHRNGTRDNAGIVSAARF